MGTVTTTEPFEASLTTAESLATTALLLLKRGHAAAASLLTSVERQTWGWAYEDWGKRFYNVLFVVPFDLLDAFDDKTLELLKDTMNAVGEGYEEMVATLRVAPSAVVGDWKRTVLAAMHGDVSNHVVLAPLTPSHPSLDRLSFRDIAELAVYRELKRVQEALPEYETLTIIPNCAARVRGRTWEPDFVVAYKQRVGIIEVDGASHNLKREIDKSRDRLLENGGIAYVDRFDAHECEDADSVGQLVKRFLAKLRDAR